RGPGIRVPTSAPKSHEKSRDSSWGFSVLNRMHSSVALRLSYGELYLKMDKSQRTVCLLTAAAPVPVLNRPPLAQRRQKWYLSHRARAGAAPADKWIATGGKQDGTYGMEGPGQARLQGGVQAAAQRELARNGTRATRGRHMILTQLLSDRIATRLFCRLH